ncbi:MAG: hypothetical protein OXH96_13180 [Spirochaetaceae bacterium]|nr:hypothetical protein [Spirochaetaceae bacterium]
MLEGMLDVGALRHTREVGMRAVHELSEEQFAATRSPGTLINSNDHPGLAECVGNPRALEALEAMGFGGSRFWKAVIISKPGPSPRLYWHQDCMWWDDPRAYRDYSPMIRRPAGTDAELDPPRVPPPARRVAAGGARQDPPGDPGLPGIGRAAGFQSPARLGKAPAGFEVLLRN